MRYKIILFIIFLQTIAVKGAVAMLPADTIIKEEYLMKIDSVANDGINRGAYPGCQIVILLNGRIAYQKSYGYHTYKVKSSVETYHDTSLLKSKDIENEILPVKNTDLFDLASITKVAATTICIMKLEEEGKINTGDKLSQYLKYLKHTNKENLTIKEILTHQAGLKAWIPFYKLVIRNYELGINKKNIYSKVKSDTFSLQVAEKMFIRYNYRDTIMKQIIDSPVSENKKYLYSDLGFYLLADLIKTVSGETIDNYVNDNFYKPMGLKRITYLPLNKFKADEIAPTENDTIFRHQLINGYVHDPGAAMLGGVSGHAGLFADALDLASLFQMLINQGIYKGKRYLEKRTIDEFTKCQFPENGNRRGLGFDKPLLSSKFKVQSSKLQVQPHPNRSTNNEQRSTNYDGPCAEGASAESFGHSGFTGTFVWADPEYKLVYVFLSNRVYLDANNNKLRDLNIRTKIQQLIYDSIEN